MANFAQMMTIPQRLNRLLQCVADAGIPVERAPLGGEGGGMAVVAGKRRLYVDTMADPATAYETTLAAIAEAPDVALDELEDVVRNDVEHARRNE